MSINFIPAQSNRKLRMAFNNDVVRFSGSGAGTTPQYADVAIFPGTTVRLYPSPNGQFYFNFMPYMATLINSNNFEDTISTNITNGSPSSFIRSMVNKICTQRMVTFTIYTNDSVTDTASYTFTWLAAAQQIGSYKEYSTTELLILSPALPEAANTCYLKYWQGYPFDFTFFSNTIGITLTNTQNLISQDFNNLGYGDRLYLSDGRTDVTLEDLIPLSEGYNLLKLGRTNHTDDKFIQLEKVPYSKGVYLKWFNAQGGYSYWLFENTYSIDRSSKSLGGLDRDFENPGNTFGRTTQIGKEVQDTYKIIAELLTPPQRDIVQNLLESPKVYLFTGQPFSRSDSQSWIEVDVKTSSARIKNARQDLTNFSFDIELPQRFTQTL